MQGGECWERSKALPQSTPLRSSPPLPALAAALALGKGRARRSVLPGLRQISSRRWHPAGAPPLRKVYLT